MRLVYFLLVCVFTLSIYADSVHTEDEVNFFVALRQNEAGVYALEKLILNELSNIESPNYGNYLTIEEVDNYVRSDPHDVKMVLKWLNRCGNHDTHANYNNDNIDCQVYVDALQCRGPKKVVYDCFDMGEQSEFYTVPDYLLDSIEFVEGLIDRGYTNSHHIRKSLTLGPSDADIGSVTREVLMRMYSLYPATADSNVSVGAMEFMDSSYSDGFSNTNLVESQTANGVPANPVAEDHIIGTVHNPDMESTLDVQVMYWADSSATLWYEASPNWMYGWATSFYNRKEVPEVVSISWGWDEMDQCSITKCTNETSQQYVARANTEFMKIVARGITILVASGDAGSPGRTNEICQSENGPNGWNHINPIFPGGSPWVTSVGATYVRNTTGSFDYTSPICTDYKNISVSCATGTTEAGCTLNVTRWTSGSGFTHWNKRPDWQHHQVKSYLHSGVELPDSKYYNKYGRAYPDVSAFGHNCLISTQMGWTNVDGTSCASPVFAGVITNLNSYQKSRGKPTLGFVNPLLYKMHTDKPQTFNDVLVGNSTCTEAYCCGQQFGFVATKGWDPVGGLGTPNIEEMKVYLSMY